MVKEEPYVSLEEPNDEEVKYKYAGPIPKQAFDLDQVSDLLGALEKRKRIYQRSLSRGQQICIEDVIKPDTEVVLLEL